MSGVDTTEPARGQMLFRAHALCFAMAALFVEVLYLAPKEIGDLERNDRRQILWRFKALCLVSLICPICVSYVILGTRTLGETLWALGLNPTSPVETIFLPTAVSASLFLGPLMEMVLEAYQEHSIVRLKWKRGGWYAVFVEPMLQSAGDLVNIRAYIFAPIVEEWVFRCCMVSALLEVGITTRQAVYTAPLYFGMAHLHHQYHQVTRCGIPIQTAVINGLVQFAYTTLFGMYEVFVFCRTRNFYSLALQHSFCSYMGLPQPTWIGKHDQLHSYRILLGLSYFGGIILFYFSVAHI